MTRSPQLVIIGAGPAGLAATAEAVAHGVRVVLLDDNPAPGGQYFRQAATGALREVAGGVLQADGQAAALLGIVEHPHVEYHPESVVFGLFDDGVLAYTQGGETRELQPDYTIIAAGATERPVPFPGWTLPGVIGAGGALNLLKSQRVLPGRRILVSANGPLGLLVSATLTRVGANVTEVVEAGRVPWLPWRFPQLLADPSTLLKGLGYRMTLLRAGAPYRTGQVVIETHGVQRVEEAVVAPINGRGELDRARARLIEADTVVTCFGLVPASEVTRALGCTHIYERETGGWIPIRSMELETTRANVFSVGDCAGIGGARAALVEGRLASLVVAGRLGGGGATDVARVAGRLRRQLRWLRWFRSALASVLSAPRDFLSLLTDDTVLCRCEEVTVRQVLALLRQGVVDIETLKTMTRISMGRCQGRNCLPTLAALIARQTGSDVAEVSLPQSRPPMRPILIGSLIDRKG